MLFLTPGHAGLERGDINGRTFGKFHFDIELRSIQAALRFEDSSVAAMKRIPSTPSSTVGTRSEAGEGLRPSRRA